MMKALWWSSNKQLMTIMKTTLICLCWLLVGVSAETQASQQWVTLNDAVTFPINDILSMKGDEYAFELPDGKTVTHPKSSVFCVGSGCQTERQLTINGCPTIGDMIMPVTMSEFAVNNAFNMGMRDWQSKEGEPSRLYSLVNPQERQFKYVSLRATGSGQGFKDFAAGKLDFMFASRQPKPEEAQAIYGVADSSQALVRRHEHLIGFDAVRVVIHPNNPLKALSIEQLANIFSGKITNWSALGGNDTAIKAYIPPSDSAAYGMFNSKVMEEHGVMYAEQSVTTLPSNRELLRTVNSDESAIAFYAAGHSGRLPQHSVNIIDDCGITHTPDDFAIKTSEYPLAHPLFLYTHPEYTESHAADVVAFMKSDQGQLGLDEYNGIVTTLPQRQSPAVSHTTLQRLIQSQHEAERALAQVLQQSQRLSSTFHFKTGSADLSAEKQDELKRLTNYLMRSELSQQKLMVVGFTSPQEADANNALALRRAEVIAEALQALGVEIDVVKGAGSIAPVACDTMKQQQVKNQRVEIWLQDRVSLAQIPKL